VAAAGLIVFKGTPYPHAVGTDNNLWGYLPNGTWTSSGAPPGGIDTPFGAATDGVYFYKYVLGRDGSVWLKYSSGWGDRGLPSSPLAGTSSGITAVLGAAGGFGFAKGGDGHLWAVTAGAAGWLDWGRLGSP
jgi:hypothetical protein